MAVNTLTLYMPGSSVGIQVYEGSQLHLILVSQGANSIPSAPGETVRQDPFPQYVDDEELAAALAGVGGGGGAVDSVNGQTGTVALDADDIGDGATKVTMTTAERTKLSGVATAATANAADATLLARANHTGTQAIATVTGLQGALDGKVTANGITEIRSMTQAAYDALGTKVATTLYVIVG